MIERIIVFCGEQMFFIEKGYNSVIVASNMKKSRFLQKDFKFNSLVWYSLSIERFERFVKCYSHIKVDSFQNSSKIILDFPEFFV